MATSTETLLARRAPYWLAASANAKRADRRGAARWSWMDARKRQQNERKFGSWHDLSNRGTLYSYEVKGRSGWRARYVKEVDAQESTVEFYQEVHDDDGKLREVHHKYPVDLGHRQVTGDEP
jgi:hypothetical protein